MFLFIFESIGTQELILIGIVALIFLGPRKLPEYARKIGKLMAEFRGTANEFKETWEREVNFEEETKALRLDSIEREAETGHEGSRFQEPAVPGTIAPPTIKPADPSAFAKPDLSPAESNAIHEETPPATEEPNENLHDESLEKHNWL
ncbi:MAG: Sec-independent protein translocase protein TatB [Pyrinomonadaceae bacterium]|nr:Sec-independent protein translocase protein TatB [Pyrinomonadaceae bacterium]